MKTINILVFCLLSFVSFSQIEAIDAHIAEYDAKIAEAVAEEMEEITPHISTTCPLMLPAIGPVNHEIDIYFEHYREESELDESGMVTICSIRKVSFQIVSGSYQFDYTYYFNANGQLIFHSERVEDADYGCTLSSYYFKDDKCIQLKSELLATEFCELPDENQPEIRTELSEIERFTVKWIQESSEKFKSLLALYADLMFN
jgi:hypothetical protein